MTQNVHYISFEKIFKKKTFWSLICLFNVLQHVMEHVMTYFIT